jgi:hypothetical protein
MSGPWRPGHVLPRVNESRDRLVLERGPLCRLSQNPGGPPRTSTDLTLFGWATGALVVAVTIAAIITLFYALNRGPIGKDRNRPPAPRSQHLTQPGKAARQTPGQHANEMGGGSEGKQQFALTA